MDTIIKYAYDEEEDIKNLFREYTDMLILENPNVKKILDTQDYNLELNSLKKKYGLPYGRLYIAKVGGVPAGCVCLRKIDDISCEIKRLYVKPQFRRNSIARKLMDRIVNDAESMGYKCILLDTLPFLYDAIKLYEKMGFYKTGSYNNNPDKMAVYMKLDL